MDNLINRIKKQIKKTIKPMQSEAPLDQEPTINTSAENLDTKPETAPETDYKAALETKIEELIDQNTDLKDKYLRLVADFDNSRKRFAKERQELYLTAGRDTMSAILPVLDDFDRVRKSMDTNADNNSHAEGITLIYNKMYNILKSKGLQAMDSNGIAFDPDFHEAITEIPAGEAMKGKVIDTVEKGYFLNEKIIRHAKVVVGN
jgi:molecular chaperone GrpE